MLLFQWSQLDTASRSCKTDLLEKNNSDFYRRTIFSLNLKIQEKTEKLSVDG